MVSNMEYEERIASFKEYIDQTKRILELSSPQLDEIRNAEDYRVHLLHSFQEIGELGAKNIRILEECFFPLVAKDAVLTDEDVMSLRTFCSLLADTTSMENLDLPLIYMQAEKILEHAEQSGDLHALIVALDNMIIAAYMMVNLTGRLYPELNVCFRYRDVGLDAGRRILAYLPKEEFVKLPDDECKELVLINSRYIRCLFEWDDKEDKTYNNEKDLRMMRQALDVANDPFYREQLPDYRWDVHVFRTLQYLSDFTEDNNSHGFNEEQLKEIYGYTKQLLAFLAEHPELEEGCPKVEQEYYVARNAYLVGERTLEDYRNCMLQIMDHVDNKDFSARGMFIALTAPLEYMLTLDAKDVTEKQQEILQVIYDNIAAYAFHMPKTGVLSFMLTFLADFLRHFIKVQGAMRFREMCLKIMAAMHPPTYVHTLNVAGITRFLAEKLLDRLPECFVGISDTTDASEVRERKEEILDFIYNGALLHDIGKLFIVETIITYGRNLVESEWELVKAHTLVGAALLRHLPETAEYAELALGHHRWFDNSSGYPDSFDMEHAKYKTAISLLEVADCIDAATDSIGRSYKKGKTLEECIAELQEGSGTRYAPFVVDLFKEQETCKALQTLLTEGRDENYRETYHLLKTL